MYTRMFKMCQKNTCQLCNFLRGYYLEENECKFKKITYCITYDKNGKCDRCENGYFLDQLSICQQVYDNSKIENCIDYINLYECRTCQEGFIPENGKCVAPEIKINNCLLYDLEDKSICKKCDLKYKLDIEGKNCIELEEVINCAVHNDYQCLQCREGYELDLNLYLENIFNLENSDRITFFFDIYNKSMLDKFTNFRFKKCKSISLENCEIVNKRIKSECDKCKPGFFLTDNLKCEAYPIEPIPNCLIYYKQTICEKCQKGFFMESETKCSLIVPIENCLHYNDSINNPTTLCVECKSLYYLDSESCILRENPEIEFCYKNKKDMEKCEKCFNGYVLSNDSLKCYIEIPNCKTYENLSEENLVCNTCEDEYYYDQQKKKCVAGNILKCKKYQKNENICLTCENGYFYNGICEKHVEMKKCDIYDQNERNKCNKCINSSLLFNQKNTCIQKTLLKNCIVYNDSSLNSICELCLTGFVVNSNGICEEFEDVNCKKKATDCIECKEDYLFHVPTKKCISSFYYLKQNCEIYEKESESVFTCKTCKENSYPIGLQKGNVCIPDEKTHYNEILFCDTYKLDGVNTKCVECQDPLSIDIINQTCSPICLKTKVIISLSFLPNNQTMKNNKNECKDVPTLINCEKAIQSSKSQNLNCFLCKKDANGVRLTYFDFAPNSITRAEKHIADFKEDELNSLSFDYLNKMEPVLCGHDNAFPTYFNVSSNDVAITNCNLYEYALVVDKNEYKCARCKLGYTGIVEGGFISQCDALISNCDLNVFYKNLEGPDTFESPLLHSSCFKCISSEKYPVFYIKKGTSRFEKVAFDLSLDPPSDGIISGVNNLMDCLELTNEDFNLDPLVTFDSIPVNCGFIYYFVDLLKWGDTADLTKLSIVCGGCKPGYKPVYDTDIIISCIEIENCKLTSSNNLFYNSCGKCVDEFSFKWNSTLLQIDNSECVSNPEFETCEIYNTDITSCELCKNGYTKNSDNKCEIIKISFCGYKKFINTKLTYAPTDIDYSYSIYQSNFGHGCTECEKNYIKFSIEDPFCVNSEYLKNTDIKSLATTSFIKYCLNYDASSSNPYMCYKCFENYIVLFPGTSCIVINSLLLNCKIASSPNTCKECLTGFILISNQCQTPAILNCKTYLGNQVEQICETCNNGFYMEDNKCMTGEISGCEIYGDSDTCLNCELRHQKVQLKDSTYCYPIPNYKNCLTYSSNFDNFELSCQICEENFIISLNSDDFMQQACLNQHRISYCMEYDFKDNFGNSTLKCLQCEETFYLKNNICEKRNHLNYNCIMYNPNEDTCEKCDFGYYLNNLQTDCLGYAEGIYGCSEYVNKETCSICKSNFYLSENKCLDLKEENIIENCIAYDSSFNCVRCLNSFFSKSQNCEPMQALNCESAKDEKTCSSCSKGYGLELLEGLTNCVLKNIPNCLESTDNFPFTCINCNQHFYLKDGVCLPVETQIQNCLIYNSDQKCDLCIGNKILSKNKDFCSEDEGLIIKLDENCHTLAELEKKTCEVCNFGYFLDSNGTCNKCENESCFGCHPKNNDSCYLCGEGYYQDAFNGECLPIPQELKEILEEEFSNIIHFVFILLISF